MATCCSQQVVFAPGPCWEWWGNFYGGHVSNTKTTLEKIGVKAVVSRMQIHIVTLAGSHNTLPKFTLQGPAPPRKPQCCPAASAAMPGGLLPASQGMKHVRKAEQPSLCHSTWGKEKLKQCDSGNLRAHVATLGKNKVFAENCRTLSVRQRSLEKRSSSCQRRKDQKDQGIGEHHILRFKSNCIKLNVVEACQTVQAHFRDIPCCTRNFTNTLSYMFNPFLFRTSRWKEGDWFRIGGLKSIKGLSLGSLAKTESSMCQWRPSTKSLPCFQYMEWPLLTCTVTG